MRYWLRFAAATIVCVVMAGVGSPLLASTRVVVTVDVESNEIFGLPGQMNAVCADGTACGLMEMVRLLNERGWPGTFFLDVYEQRKWGETTMRNLALALQSAGQDVALHTHPQWAYDPARWAMHQYSLEEQTTIVRDGVRLLQAWTGLPVVAHRAGAYAADENTLVALTRNGILLDSSRFWTYPASRLDGLGLPRNLPGWHGSLLEIPVTVHQRDAVPRLFGEAFAPVTSTSKIDPNWFVSEDEMRSAIDAEVAADIPVLVVFLHSFSFLGKATDGAPSPDRTAMKMFRAMLDHIGRKNLQVVTMRALARQGLALRSSGREDFVPRVKVPIDLSQYAWHRARAIGRVSLSVGVGLALLLLSAWFVLAGRRKATGRWAHQKRVSLDSPVPSGEPGR